MRDRWILDGWILDGWMLDSLRSLLTLLPKSRPDPSGLRDGMLDAGWLACLLERSGGRVMGARCWVLGAGTSQKDAPWIQWGKRIRHNMRGRRQSWRAPEECNYLT